MSFQKGDRIIEVDGQSYYLRLTIGALAELTECLDAPSPKDLGQRFRSLSEDDLQHVVTALLRHKEQTLPKDNLAAFLPAIADIFEESFGGVDVAV